MWKTENRGKTPLEGINSRKKIMIYFSSANDESKTRCEDECEEVYYSFFTYGKCVGDIFGKLPKDQQPACNLRCGVRPRLWTTIGLFCVFAAALATLIFTIPMCVATCASCLHAKKANKNAKRVVIEQQSQPSKDQQVATMGYNPYAYWPYYGRA
ncbi:hypothetical protein Q1695_010163 [Nippostrongylus brasiliensis]|nr:hypothetical protein Q1695_010163 [Nippostrongylus brasiliensis]